MRFPLPPNTFPPVNLSEDDEEALEAIAEAFIKKTVTQYFKHLTKHNGVVNQNRWKSVKHHDDLRVYRERRAYRRDASNQADHDDVMDGVLAMLTCGTTPGTLDDVMYGMLSPTTEDMVLKSAYIDDGFVDWGVLASIIQPTPESPFRQLSIKWAVKGHPFLVGAVLRRGDAVYIESIGFAVSPNGERIGYNLQHSVDIPGVRELEELNIIRARTSLCHLFRQRDANTVDVYIRGLIVHAGGSPILVAASGAEVCISVWKYVHCAEMKKLTRIVQSSLAARLPSITSASAMPYASSSSSSSSASSSLESWSMSSSTASSSSSATSSDSTCGRCHERVGGRMASLVAASTPRTSTSRKEKHCRICRLRLCSRCRVYKEVFLRTDREKVCSQTNMAFCTQCAVLAAHASSRSFAEDDVLERSSKQSNNGADQDESDRGGRAFGGRASMASSVVSSVWKVDM